jgi:hypothetical protein
MPAATGSTAPAVADNFLDLVCADQDWLRSEFEEIIAASWGEPPRLARPRWTARPPGWPGRRSPYFAPVADPSDRVPGRHEGARQRSPP